KMFVILFVEHLEEVVDTHCDADHLFCVSAKIRSESVELQVIGNQDVISNCGQSVHSVQEILLIDVPGSKQVVHRDLHQDNHVDTFECRFLQKLGQRTSQHVFVYESHGPKTAAFNDDRLFVKNRRGLQDFA